MQGWVSPAPRPQVPGQGNRGATLFGNLACQCHCVIRYLVFRGDWPQNRSVVTTVRSGASTFSGQCSFATSQNWHSDQLVLQRRFSRKGP